MLKRPLIAIVDDDDSVRESVKSLVRSVGYDAAVFATAQAFLSSARRAHTDCLILDVHMPGMSGLELQRLLAAAKSRIPIIFITAYGADQGRMQALRDGAVDFLFKPFGEEVLLKAVAAALKN